jgi:hypothetical protein
VRKLKIRRAVLTILVYDVTSEISYRSIKISPSGWGYLEPPYILQDQKLTYLSYQIVECVKLPRGIRVVRKKENNIFFFAILSRFYVGKYST